ncbi:hypothetical protein Tco_0063333, partial [Tanacetum coccineum]
FEIHNQDLKEDGGADLEGSTAGVEERTEEMDTYNTTGVQYLFTTHPRNLTLLSG